MNPCTVGEIYNNTPYIGRLIEEDPKLSNSRCSDIPNNLFTQT